MSRQHKILKLRDALNLMKVGKPFTLRYCRYDKERKQHNGERDTLHNATLISYQGYGLANLRLANGDVRTIHPVLIEYFNQQRVLP